MVVIAFYAAISGLVATYLLRDDKNWAGTLLAALAGLAAGEAVDLLFGLPSLDLLPSLSAIIGMVLGAAIAVAIARRGAAQRGPGDLRGS
jgi:uncharacterized membrane protein YeaQ/YmgE (transglycosylase-associated protein family)